MIVPFANLKRQYISIQKELRLAEQDVFRKGVFILGDTLEKFENEFASYLGVKYCVGVDNGTSALNLALKALKIGKNEEVITVANSFIASVLSIIQNHASPVLVDCNNYYNIDIKSLEEKITKKTKAIIVVHLFGQPCQIDKVLEIAKRNHIYVIEDAAQAHGATYQDKKAGSFGDIGCFSFYPTKNLGCFGDGGAVVTNNAELKDRLTALRNYGQTKKYYHESIGFNNRLDELQAAFLRVKLKYLDRWNNKRRVIAQKYNQALKTDLIVPGEIKDTRHIYHLYVIRTAKRDRLQKFLTSKGIASLVHYPVPIHLQKICKSLGYKTGSFPKTEQFAKEILSLPIYPEINESETNYVIGSIKEFLS